MKDKYKVEFGKYDMTLSSGFLAACDAESNLEEIKAKFIIKYKLFTKMDETDNSNELKALAEEVKQNEFSIQELFNFPRNFDFHRWWEVPKCLCPKMDNQDCWGTKYNYHNTNCPVHGGKSE